MLIVINSGLPSEMDDDDLEDDVLEAHSIAAMQHAHGYRPRASALSFYPDPAGGGSGRISAADLNVLKEKFPQLCDFSTEFLQSRTMDELGASSTQPDFCQELQRPPLPNTSGPGRCMD